MKNSKIVLALICSSVAALAVSTPAKAEMGQNSIGPSVSFGGGASNFGVDSKIEISDNFSLRPFAYFPTGGTDFGTAITYDFKNTKSRYRYRRSSSPITPFIGSSVSFFNSGNTNVTTVSLVGGADFEVNDSIQLKAGVVVPLNKDAGQITGVTLGAGFRF
jgi:opacity protein-like surface antigen